MILQRTQLANHTTMKVFGPGDVLGRLGAAVSMLISESAMSAVEGTQLAVLGTDFLAAARRWPPLTAGLHIRLAQQAERLGVQLAICQLSRVDERLLALLWWLAEAWGRVTSVGTVVPISMTHDVLGALVGARRPTVTLALGELVERGAIVRQDRGWLLLEPPPGPAGAASEIDDPELVPSGGRPWQSEEPRAVDIQETRRALLETVGRLRDEHRRRAAEVETRLRELRRTREALTARRQGAGATPRRAPSS
jgi:CRP-like cAMP-binding protein